MPRRRRGPPPRPRPSRRRRSILPARAKACAVANADGDPHETHHAHPRPRRRAAARRVAGDLHGRPDEVRDQVPAGRDRRDQHAGGPVLQGAAAAERALLRPAQPDARKRRRRSRRHVGEDAARSRLRRAVADHRRQAVLRRRAGQRGRRARPPVADGALEPRRGVQQDDDARRDLHRPRPDHERDAASRPTRTRA